MVFLYVILDQLPLFFRDLRDKRTFDIIPYPESLLVLSIRLFVPCTDGMELLRDGSTKHRTALVNVFKGSLVASSNIAARYADSSHFQLRPLSTRMFIVLAASFVSNWQVGMQKESAIWLESYAGADCT